MDRADWMTTLKFWLYRVSTIGKSIKTLYTLPPEKVDAFVNSYQVYDYDWSDEQTLIKDLGKDYLQEVRKKVVDYYCVLNHLLAIGQVEKMYIPPSLDLSKSIMQNQDLFEERMCKDLGAKKGNKLLDIGCGRGRVASHMARMSGAHVTGINPDHDQLESAKRYSERHGLPCTFQWGDVNALSFPDNTFDHIYEIQVVFSLSRNLGEVFKNIHRMLKPGGRFGCLDWVSKEKYNPKDPHHQDLLRRIKPLIGAIGTPGCLEVAELLKKAGFKILKAEDVSLNGMQAPLIQKADKFFTRVGKTIEFLVKYKMIPAHFKRMFDRLTQDADAFIEADEMGITTSSYYVLAEKS